MPSYAFPNPGYARPCVRAVWAQTSSGVVSGSVVDPGGAFVPAADVVLIHQLTGVKLTTKTDSAGAFIFPSVQPGQYSISIEASGFKRLEKVGYTLTASERLGGRHADSRSRCGDAVDDRKCRGHCGSDREP